MADGNKENVNRRQILGGIGAVGAIGLSSVQTVSASESTQKPTIVEAVQSEEVRQLLDEFGFTVPQPDDATISTVEGPGSSAYLTTVEIPVEGDVETVITYSKIHDGNATGKAEAFVNLQEVTQYRLEGRKLDADVEGRLVSNGNEIVTIREVTKQEKRILSRILDRDIDTFVAGTNDNLNGYTVTDRSGKGFIVHGSSTEEVIVKTTLGPSGQSISEEPKVVPVEKKPSILDGCDDWCMSCASSITAAGTCLGACAGVTAATPLIGWIACFTCAQGGGILTGYACSACIDCKGIPI